MKLSNVFRVAVLCLLTFTIVSTEANAQCNGHKKTTYKSSYQKSSHSSRSNSKDLVGLAVSNDNLSTLVAAVKAAGLVETLQDGTFTVFAPTNEAFAALPAGTVENLLKPENKAKLIKVLTYHVVPGRIESTDLRNGQKVATVQGSKVAVTANEQIIKIDNAVVKTANIRGTNGVVHVIDRVILPSDL